MGASGQQGQLSGSLKSQVQHALQSYQNCASKGQPFVHHLHKLRHVFQRFCLIHIFLFFLFKNQINEFSDDLFVAKFKGDFQVNSVYSVVCTYGSKSQLGIFSLYFVFPFLSESMATSNSQLSFILECVSTYTMIQIFLQCS